MRTAVAVGLGALGLLAGGGIAYAATRGSAAPAAGTAPLASSYNAATAIPVGLGGSITIPLGSSLTVENPAGSLWQTPGVTTDNAAVMAPSSPATTNGFVAVALGTATLSGSYQDSSGATMTGSVAVTVIAVGAGAIGSGSGAAGAANPGAGSSGGGGSGSGGTSLPAAVTASAPAAALSSLPAGSPDGLVASSPTATGWQESISILPNRAGLSYLALFGDQIRVSLPSGAHWRQSVSSIGPRTGTDDFVFTYIDPVTLVLAYTDAANLDTGTTLTFTTGGVFAATSHLSAGDYVILAVANADVGQIAAGYAAWQANPSAATPEQQQEVVAFSAALSGIQQSGQSIDLVQAFALLAMVGPWAKAFGVDVRTWALFRPNDALPAWWPQDDANRTSEVHFVYRYIGPGIDVASLPFPVTAWKRVA